MGLSRANPGSAPNSTAAAFLQPGVLCLNPRFGRILPLNTKFCASDPQNFQRFGYLGFVRKNLLLGCLELQGEGRLSHASTPCGCPPACRSLAPRVRDGGGCAEPWLGHPRRSASFASKGSDPEGPGIFCMKELRLKDHDYYGFWGLSPS